MHIARLPLPRPAHSTCRRPDRCDARHSCRPDTGRHGVRSRRSSSGPGPRPPSLRMRSSTRRRCPGRSLRRAPRRPCRRWCSSRAASVPRPSSCGRCAAKSCRAEISSQWPRGYLSSANVTTSPRLWRHIRAVVLLPGTVTIVIPGLLVWATGTNVGWWSAIGALVLAAGLALFAWTVDCSSRSAVGRSRPGTRRGTWSSKARTAMSATR